MVVYGEGSTAMLRKSRLTRASTHAEHALLLKKQRNEFVEGATPGEPFMVSAWRFVVDVVDTGVGKGLADGGGTEVFFASHAEE